MGEVATDSAADAHGKQHEGHDQSPLEYGITDQVRCQGGKNEFSNNPGTAGGED